MTTRFLSANEHAHKYMYTSIHSNTHKHTHTHTRTHGQDRLLQYLRQAARTLFCDAIVRVIIQVSHPQSWKKHMRKVGSLLFPYSNSHSRSHSHSHSHSHSLSLSLPLVSLSLTLINQLLNQSQASSPNVRRHTTSRQASTSALAFGPIPPVIDAAHERSSGTSQKVYIQQY